MSGVTIRRAAAADLESYLDLREAVAEERMWIAIEPPVTDRQETGRRVAEAMTLDHRLVLVADAAGHIVGSLGADDTRGRVSLGMMVAADWRGRGIGGGLVAKCLAWAKKRRAHKVTLEVWPHNTPPSPSTAATASRSRGAFAATIAEKTASFGTPLSWAARSPNGPDLPGLDRDAIEFVGAAIRWKGRLGDIVVAIPQCEFEVSTRRDEGPPKSVILSSPGGETRITLIRDRAAEPIEDVWQKVDAPSSAAGVIDTTELFGGPPT